MHSRRHFLKLIILSGCSIYFPSCLSDNKKGVITSTPTNPDSALNFLEENINENDVVFLKKEDVDYKARCVRFNKRIAQEPKIIALCKNEKGIQQALKVAKEEQLAVSIKSGGHSFEGFSSNNGGMCMDLSLMDSITYINENEIVVGPANTLGKLNNELLPNNRLLPGGSCATVGIGGLALGGGYGFFARKYGLTCDSLVEVKMVNGHGEIISSENDSELLWACRGGGNGNFGVIYEMRFKTYPKPKQFAAHRFKAYKLDLARAKDLMQIYFEAAITLPYSAFAAFVLNGSTLTILLTDFESDSSKLQAFIQLLKPKSDKYSEVVKTDIAKALSPFYGVQTPLYFKNASAGLYKSFEDIAPIADPLISKIINSKGILYQLNTLGGNIQNQEFEKLGAYPHRAYPFFSELQAYYDTKSQEIEKLKQFEEIQQLFHAQRVFPQYRNYPDINFPNWEEAYYGINYERLQKVKAKHDPDNIIRHPQSIRPKMP